MLSEFCLDICPWADIAVAFPVLTYGQYIDVITYKYVIKKYCNECLIKELDTSKNFGNPTYKNTRFDKSQVIHSFE